MTEKSYEELLEIFKSKSKITNTEAIKNLFLEYIYPPKEIKRY